MQRTRARFIRLALTLLAAAGCNDSTEVALSDVQGRYVLVLVDSTTPPAVLSESATSISRILADTLRMFGDYRATRTVVSTWEDLVQHRIVGPSAWISEYRYRIVREKVEMRFICPINAACTSSIPITAAVADGVLQFNLDGRHYVYARISRAPD